MQNKFVKSLIWLLILVFVLAPFDFSSLRFQRTQAQWWEGQGYTIIDESKTWKKTDNLLFAKSVIITNNATLTIEKGATVRFSQGGDIFIPSLIVESGNIIAEGTQDDKITFTADTDDDRYAIDFYPDPSSNPSFFRYVEISKGGYMPSISRNNNFFINTASAAMGGSFAFKYTSGKAHFENSEFKDNYFGDVSVSAEFNADNSGDYLEIVNSNFPKQGAIGVNLTCLDLEDPETGDVYPDPDCSKRALFKNNWYGDINGPTTDELLFTLGSKISGDYYSGGGFRTKELIADPVIVVPGILGSAQFGKEKEWKLDPITYTYVDFVSSLEANGYEKGKNLFDFPYDWRRSNADTALDLKSKIAEVVGDTKVSKVDLVAHSMGGLVARKYIETDYADNVDQLVTMGTPHRGSPKAYLRWEAGEGFFGWQEAVAKRHLTHEAEENGYTDLQKYIQEKVVSVKELLPDYDYLFDSFGNVKAHPQNSFLEGLNSSANVANLQKVDFTNIIGNLDNDQSTISKIRVTPSAVVGKWEHGMPENFYDTNSDRGLEYGQGDETVPKFSAESINASSNMKVDSSHSDLPTMAECEVVHELANVAENKCHHVNSAALSNIFMINVFSPVDIQIISPSGQRAGKDFATGEFLAEIPGAYYSGYDNDNNSEFITIPNPEDGEYKILTQGTGSGEYRIEMTKISEDPSNPQIVSESTGTVSGTATTGITEEKIMTVEGDNVIGDPVVETQDAEAPNVIVQSLEENKNYFNNQILPIQFTAEDNVSASDKIAVQKYLDDNLLTGDSIDLSLEHLGTHTLKIIATDETGNIGQKEISFATETNIQAIQDNVSHYFSLGLIPNKGKKTEILARLNVLEKASDLKKQIKQSRLKMRMKNIILKELDRLIEHEIENLIGRIGKMKNYHLSSQAKELIIESLNFLK